jgi:hypothetical protein
MRNKLLDGSSFSKVLSGLLVRVQRRTLMPSVERAEQVEQPASAADALGRGEKNIQSVRGDNLLLSDYQQPP